MDIDALRSFIAFVDTGSFTRAAKQTFRSQSAISMQMKKLEEDTGQPLFVKEGRNVALTERGQELVSYARRILSLHDEAVSHFKHSTHHRPLVMGCPDDYAESILPTVTALIRELLPNQAFKIVCDCSTELRLMLDAGKIDIAILTRAPDAEEGYLLKHDRGVWVYGSDPSVLEQSPLPLVLYEPDCKFHSAAIDGMEKQERDYSLMVSSSSATAIKSLLRRGIGVSAMAVSSVSHGINIVQDNHWPALPAVDIVLSVAPVPHPAFGVNLAAKISQRFLQEH
ncbi:LysR family transcriptional regulator [Rhodanobacter aciditrophus]|uniref:LysR family transcriptional regulator n=1 Tax=Rhodanobacter aciditrophus TaxID=1623218 RepID=A0ABW4B0Z5_9GAMM